MTCASCVRRVETALSCTDVVTSADVNYALGRAKITYDPSKASRAQIADAIVDAGYDVPAAEVRLAPRGERGRLRSTLATVMGGLVTVSFRCVALAPREIVALVAGVVVGAAAFVVAKWVTDRA